MMKMNVLVNGELTTVVLKETEIDGAKRAWEPVEVKDGVIVEVFEDEKVVPDLTRLEIQ